MILTGLDIMLDLTEMARDTILRCYHYGVPCSLIYLTLLHTLVLPPGTALPTCDLHSVFNTDPQAPPRPFWLMSQDPLQPAPHQVTRWVLHPSHIQVSHGWTMRDFRQVGSYSLTCVSTLEETRTYGVGDQPETTALGGSSHKVLFTLDDGEEGTRYVCMVITLRGPIIFQTKMSKLVTEVSDVTTAAAELCRDGSLQDQGLTFVNFEHTSTGLSEDMQGRVDYVPCPLNGGYAIASWTDETGSTKCESPKMGNLRVEDECEPGEGVVFSEGISRDCKNPVFGEIYKDFPLRCFSKWSDRGYDYAIALAENPTSVYCIRVATDWSTATEMYLFKDGVCDTTTDILYSKKYVQIALLTHSIASPCSDVSPWCSSYDTQTLSSTEMKPLCEATLGHCDPVFWENIRVPEALRGSWYRETLALGVDTIQLTDTHFTSQTLGRWRYTGEAGCLDISPHGLQDQGTFHFLISHQDNGCRPRVALLWLMPVSSTVQLFQLSRGETLLQHGDLSPATLCSKYHFTFGDTNEVLRDRYYVEAFAWQNLVRTDVAPPVLAKCDVSEWGRLQVGFPQGAACTVSLTQDGDYGFTVTVQSCTTATHLPLNKPIHHVCLAQYKGKYGWTSFLLTRTPLGGPSLGGGRQYLCWLFEDPRGWLMPVGDCSDETVVEVGDLKVKTALADLSLTLPVTGGAAPLGAPGTLVVGLSVLVWFYHGS